MPRQPNLTKVDARPTDPNIRGVSGALWAAATPDDKVVWELLQGSETAKERMLTDLVLLTNFNRGTRNDDRPDPRL